MNKLLKTSLCFALLGLLLLLPVFCRGATIEQERATLPRLYHFTGHSMEPVLPYDNWMMVWWKPYKDLKVGDVAFNGDTRMLHKIVGRNGPLFITQGTNKLTNSKPDRVPLTPSNYVGCVHP